MARSFCPHSKLPLVVQSIVKVETINKEGERREKVKKKEWEEKGLGQKEASGERKEDAVWTGKEMKTDKSNEDGKAAKRRQRVLKQQVKLPGEKENIWMGE